ncbi:hypothetical protein AU193_09840 [Mycobacterium sp. GA-1285]|nr:hypothetical protein AU193_09840 [Mycobacterium sp. GA-1285]
MLKRFLLGGVAAGAMAVPFAGAAWAQPAQPPVPPPGVDENGSTCVIADAFPSNLEVISANEASTEVSTEASWREVGQVPVPVVGPLAGELGVAPGQTVSVYCTPAGFQEIRWNPAAQPTPPAQPAPLGQPEPAQQNPQPGPTALDQQVPQDQR